MKRLAVSLFLLSMTPAAHALFSSDTQGTAAAQFLTLGGGARAAGMGTAQTAAAEGASSVIWNPAAMAGAPGPEIEAMHGDWFEDADYNFAAGVLPFGNGKAFSVSFQQFSAGDLTRRDDNGFEEGSFEPGDLAGGLGFAVTTEDAQWGINAKLVKSEIVSSAQTFAADLGALSKENNGRRWGIAILNLGGKLKFDSEEEKLPMMGAIGGRQKFGAHSVTMDIKAPTDNHIYVAAGLEGVLPMGEGMAGFGRLGYSSRPGSAAGSFTGFSFGAGVRVGLFSIDYALAPFGDLGSVHVFSVALKTTRGSWGEQEPR